MPINKQKAEGKMLHLKENRVTTGDLVRNVTRISSSYCAVAAPPQNPCAGSEDKVDSEEHKKKRSDLLPVLGIATGEGD
jgi:hypothetical protein